MKIAELYRSIQGEGRLTGVESVFVRTSGCNLRCWFCDTPYASWSPEGEDWSIDEIVDRIEQLGTNHIVITGGEPMLFAELVPLTERLQQRSFHVTIETAGTLDLNVRCQLMSISPKLAGSAPSATEHPQWHRRHERSRHAPQVIRRLVSNYDYQLKFVIDQPSELPAVSEWLADFPQVDAQHVWLMPQGIEAAELDARRPWLEPYCRTHGYQFCPRRHIEWFGKARGV